jgi:hypothetical protein
VLVQGEQRERKEEKEKERKRERYVERKRRTENVPKMHQIAPAK